ncbi:MAG: hypothetical protein JW818_15545 [Pirellulales bacterium]|nr:hypothetical protein [Pirellulales bacterium]
MRKMLLAATLAMLASSSVGCITPIYSGDRTERTQQLIDTSENLRAAKNTWSRVWFLDQPDHCVPERMHGGIM